jgi:hypothetical protein
MLRFKAFQNGAPVKSVNLEGAHLLGADRVPLRAELRFVDGEIVCEPRVRGAAALAIMWPVKGLGETDGTPTGAAGGGTHGRMMLETTRLIERSKPYILNLELARGQLMRISLKREDWGLYDFAEGQPVYDQVDRARDLLVAALTAPNDVKAAELGDDALAASVHVAEAVAMFHADMFLKHRIAAHQLVKRPLGCRLDPGNNCQALAEPLSQAFDFAVLPFSWRTLEPQEGHYQSERLDRCVQLVRQKRIPIWGQSLISLEESHLPDWLHSYAGDYDQVRERVVRQIKFVLKRFGPHVRAWEVISGIHAHNAFRFSFEHLMDLTRTAAILVRQMVPSRKVIIGITLPWGEYYAGDPRTIPPLLYAEMAVESGINFDAFGLEMQFGIDPPGIYVRDLMQVSALLDRFGSLGRTLHITAAGVPSAGEPTAQGLWRGEWSEEVQTRWAREFYRIALSKPFVETVSWRNAVDAPTVGDFGGLFRGDLSPKPAYRELLSLHQALRSAAAASHSAAAPEPEGDI